MLDLFAMLVYFINFGHFVSFLFILLKFARRQDFGWNILTTLGNSSQALHGLAPKCKLINMHELIKKSTNDYVTLLSCENGANVNNKG